jgi:cobalt-zinc-cadmium resistance protein CzcA
MTVLPIVPIPYMMFRPLKWATLILVNAMLALEETHTNFSVSSGVGFLALFGVSVQTGAIMLEYINQRRAQRLESKTPPSRGRCCGCVPS